MKNRLRYGETLKDTYFISKILHGQEPFVPGMSMLGRIGKQDFVNLIDQQLRAYEREYKNMDLHLIEEIIDMIAYIERSLSQ